MNSAATWRAGTWAHNGGLSIVRALITGIGGFVGRHLLQHLQEEGDEVAGVGRAADCESLPESLRVFHADLTDRAAIEDVIRELRPEAIYHLAAQSSTGDSLVDPWATLGNNLRAQLNLLESVLAVGDRARVLIVGSSDEYGRRAARRCADRRERAVAPDHPVCGQQGRPGHARPSVLRAIRPPCRSRAAVQPHRARPRLTLRHSQLRASTGRNRSRRARAGPARRQPGRRARLLGRARHGSGVPSGGPEGRAGRGLQSWQRARGAVSPRSSTI